MEPRMKQRRHSNNYSNNSQRSNNYRSGGRSNNNNNSNNRQRSRKNYAAARDKYMNQAKDALSHGDRVQAEFYFQYAEHYVRLLNEANEEQQAREATQRDRNNDDDADEENASSGQADASTQEDSADGDDTEAPSRPLRKRRAPAKRTSGGARKQAPESDGEAQALPAFLTNDAPVDKTAAE